MYVPSHMIFIKHSLPWEQAWQPFDEIKLFQKHRQFSVAATAESHQSVSSDTCLSLWIHPSHICWEWNPPPTWWQKLPRLSGFCCTTYTLILHQNYLRVLGVKIKHEIISPDTNNVGCIHCSCKPALFSLFPARLEGSQHYYKPNPFQMQKGRLVLALVLAAHIKKLGVPVCSMRPTN